MTSRQRRDILRRGSALAVGGMAGYALSGNAAPEAPRTPENVGPVVRGDVMEGHIDGLPNIQVKVV